MRFPANKFLVESTVVDWNFCSVIDNGQFYDHQIINGRSIRTPSKEANTDEWQGFRVFGLLEGVAASFQFTTPYKDNVIKSLADHRLQQRYIAHCLPHPDDLNLYRADKRNFISRVFSTNHSTTNYKPIEWKMDCSHVNPKLANKSAENIKTPERLLTVVSPPATPDNEKTTPSTSDTSTELKTVDTISVEDKNQPIPKLAAANSPPATNVVVNIPQKSDTNKTSLPENAGTATATLVVPENGVAVPFKEIPVTPKTVSHPPIVITGPLNGSAIVSSAANNSKGLSGSISLENRSFRARDTSLKIALAYKPKKDSYWFIRSAANISQDSSPLTYSWGIGYDDWHPGTWAAQLNHWGPLKPGDGLDIDNAVAEISYKLKPDWLSRNHLSSTLAIASLLSGKPSLSWGWSWNPYSHWFIRTTAIKPLDTSGINWSYGFGYTRYNHISLSFEYNNWGVNEFPDHNFRKNGQLSLIYRWAF